MILQILIFLLNFIYLLQGQQCDLSAVSPRETILFSDGYYGSGWSDYGNGYQPPGADKVNGYVRLKGLASGTGGTIATLPVGWRPARAHIHTSNQHTTAPNNVARIDIRNDGTIRVNNGQIYSWISLDGMGFFVDE